jgi:hypothetical protein
MACLRNQWVNGFVMMCAMKVLDFGFEKGRELKHREAVDIPYLYLIYATMIGLFSYDNAV